MGYLKFLPIDFKVHQNDHLNGNNGFFSAVIERKFQMINLFSNKIKNYLFKKKLKFIDVDDPHTIFSDIWNGNSQNGELITNAKYLTIKVNPMELIEKLLITRTHLSMDGNQK